MTSHSRRRVDGHSPYKYGFCVTEVVVKKPEKYRESEVVREQPLVTDVWTNRHTYGQRLHTKQLSLCNIVVYQNRALKIIIQFNKINIKPEPIFCLPSLKRFSLGFPKNVHTRFCQAITTTIGTVQSLQFWSIPSHMSSVIQYLYVIRACRKTTSRNENV